MRLRAWLDREGISATAFGQKVGVENRQTMSRYVRGERLPPAEVLKRIREATNGEVTYEDLVEQHLAQPA